MTAQDIEVSFNKHFYPLDIIQKAAEDYKEFADIGIAPEEKSIRLVLRPKQKIKNLKGEFCNYVLGLFMDKYNVQD